MRNIEKALVSAPKAAQTLAPWAHFNFFEQVMSEKQSAARRHSAKYQQGFVSLSDEVRTHVDTACAAYHLGRQPQTMRVWASAESGPIRPNRVNGRLAWPVTEIRKLLAL